MHDNNPVFMAPSDWKELFAIQHIKDMWGIEPHETWEMWKSVVYVSKFDFISGSPGYVGDMFLIMGDHLTGPPLCIIRDRESQLLTLCGDEGIGYG